MIQKDRVQEKRHKKALIEWEKYGNFIFTQEEDNVLSNIQFIAAKELDNVATGFPNYQDELCSKLRGRIIMTDHRITDCSRFYVLCLHEIGHVLGLGHVGSQNVMKSGLKENYEGLQDGDIKGIIEIYGEK